MALRWEVPEGAEQIIRGYSVEIPQYGRREFTEKPEIVVEGLPPYTKILVQVRSCIRADASVCGAPAFFDAKTGAAG